MVIVGIFKMKMKKDSVTLDFDKDVDEWYPCKETEQSTQDVVLNFPADQITWNNLELAVCNIFKVELNSETS